MNTRRNWSVTLLLFLLLLALAGCDFFGGDDSPVSPSFQEQLLQQTSIAKVTLTAAPRETWTAQAHQTLTALPANETATGVAMGATETSAAIATKQLFTREAQTVAANRTATKLALERGTNTPTQTPTFTRTLIPTSTQTSTSTPTATITPTQAPQLAKCDSDTLGRIQQQGQNLLNNLYKGKPTKQVRKDVTDVKLAFSNPAQLDHLSKANASMLYNGYTLDGQPQQGDTWSFQLIALCFPVSADAVDFVNISRAQPTTLQDRKPYPLSAPPYANDVQCETAKTAPQNNVQLDAARCEMLEDYFVIMWFITAFGSTPDTLHEEFSVPYVQDLATVFNP